MRELAAVARNDTGCGAELNAKYGFMVDIGAERKGEFDGVKVIIDRGPNEKTVTVDGLVQSGGEERVEVRMDATEDAEVRETPAFVVLQDTADFAILPEIGGNLE